MQIKKLVVGIRPQTKLFRVWTGWGDVADAIISSLPAKPFRDATYFTGIAHAAEPPGGVQLRGGDDSRRLSITSEDILFSKDCYSVENSSLGFETFSEEFLSLWSTIDSTLDVEFVRRIGLVAEHRITDVKDPSGFLLRKLSTFPPPPIAARYVCQFEKRVALPDGAAPNVATSDFFNVIYSFYDSAADTEKPHDDALNFNIDVQRYYAPPLGGDGVGGALRKLKEMFDLHRREFYEEMNKLGITQR
jgi:hypothetical protein